MKKNKKLILYIGIPLTILIVIACFKSCNRNAPLEVTTEVVGRRNIIETVTANGKVQPEVEVKISPDVSGEIIGLYVKEGDQVKKGDLLVKINPDIYVSARERMAATLNSSRASLANTRARLAQVKAQFINAESSFKRNSTLYKQGALSESEYDAANAAYEVAKADVEAAEQSVIGADYSVKSTEAGLKEANDNLLKTTIVAPVDGTISMLNIEKGERVVGTMQMTGTEILRIANLTEMEVNVDVNENDIVRVSLGDLADIEVDAYLGRKFKGMITSIANSAKTAGLNADQVTNFEVKIRILRTSYEDLLDKQNLHLSPFRPGMTASVDIKTHDVNNVISVPIQAVTTREDTAKKTKDNASQAEEVQEFVFLLKKGKARLTKVKTGIQDNKYIEITSGLKEKDEVITGPYNLVSKELKNKDKVILKTEEEKTDEEEEVVVEDEDDEE